MKKLLLSTLLGVGTLMSSCIKEPPCPSQEILQIESTDIAFSPGDEIGIYAVDQGDLQDIGNYADNKRYRYDGEFFIPVTKDDEISLPRNAVLKYFVYYPYNNAMENTATMKQTVVSNRQMKMINSYRR